MRAGGPDGAGQSERGAASSEMNQTPEQFDAKSGGGPNVWRSGRETAGRFSCRLLTGGGVAAKPRPLHGLKRR